MSEIEVPDGWELQTIEDICEIITSGGTPSRSNPSYFNGNIPWVKMTDLKTDLILNTKERLTESGIKNSSAKIFPKDTVLIAMYTFDMGKTAILGIDAATNQAICGLQCKNIVLPKFLFYFIKSHQKQIKKLGSGGVQPNINQNKVKSLCVPLPNLEIQKKIIHKLDNVLEKFEKKKQEMIQLTVENQSKIRSLKGNLLLSLIRKLVSPDELKEGWSLEPLSSICDIERGKFGHRPRNDPDFFDGKYPFIQTGDIARSDGRVKTYSQTLNERGLKVSRMFPKGTVVITIAANIGDTAILEFDSCFPDSIIGITPKNKKAIPEYVEYVLRLYQNDLKNNAIQGAQKNINYGFLKPLKIPVPPDIFYQHDIVKQIEKSEVELKSIMIYFEKFEKKQNMLIAHLYSIQQSVIHSAFSGKLIN